MNSSAVKNIPLIILMIVVMRGRLTKLTPKAKASAIVGSKILTNEINHSSDIL